MSTEIFANRRLLNPVFCEKGRATCIIENIRLTTSSIGCCFYEDD